MKNKIRTILDSPETLFEKSYSFLIIFLVFFSIFEILLESHSINSLKDYESTFIFMEYFTIFVFTIEYIVRILVSDSKKKFVFSIYGITDLLAVLPTYMSFLGLPLISTAWIRSIKIIRLVKILKIYRNNNSFGGVTGKTIPYIAAAIAFKGISILLEAKSWWPEIGNLNIIIGVVGFALAVLLGTKLSVVNTRIYAIEDTVCRIVGGLRDMQYQSDIKPLLLAWAISLDKALRAPYSKKSVLAEDMRIKTDQLEGELEERSIGGPNTAAFHRDVAYLLHRLTATTPVAYETFLKSVMVAYAGVVILTIPGLVGLISSVLLVYILSGIYLLIEDMDRPLEYSEDSFIDVRLDPLEFYIRVNS